MTKKPKSNLTLADIEITPYQDQVDLIAKKIGKAAPMPTDLAKGDWTEQSIKVLEERYLRRDDEGNLTETPEGMCWRVAWDMASAEAKWGKGRKEVIKIAKDFYKLLVSCKFLPNSPTLMNAGTGNGLQYSGCYVIPVGDSLVEIFDAIKYQALIHQTGGGTGFGFSRLRPKGSIVNSSKGTASGPISFMKIFDAATNQIKQGGKRRGANMGILRVDHPDILDFIHCKEAGGITNFNISVAITDRFMKAYEKNEDYELMDPRTDKVVGKLSARRVFDEIAQGAWRTGDPGMVFIDRLNRGTSNPVPALGPIESTNPCGEQPLYPFDSCNLGSIFLSYFVKTSPQGKKEVDWDGLRQTTKLALRFMDNVIEMNPYPLEQVKRTTLGIRRIGLGVGGWADMLIDLGIPYDSDEALSLGEKIMKVIQDEAVLESENLAVARGIFPMFPVSIYKDERPRRNSTVTTIAPTGSISILAGASSGIEPLFAIAYQHKVKYEGLDRTLTFFNPKFENLARERGFWTEEIRKKVAEAGTVGHVDGISEDVKRLFVTAHEIHHDWHIKMQSAFQKYTENAVSKTINMTNSVSVDEIKDAYLLAWKTDCKGITVFRDGCKDAQVLNLGIKSNEEKKQDIVQEVTWVRPVKMYGSTYKVKTPVGSAFITVNHDEGNNPVEVFINIGKAGSDVQAMAEALGRVISKSLKFGRQTTSRDRAQILLDQLRGIGGRRSVGFGPNKVLSLPDAVAQALSWHLGISNGISAHSATEATVSYTNGHSNDVHLENGNGKSNGHAHQFVEKEVVSETVSMGTVDANGPIGESGLNVAMLTTQVSQKVIKDLCPSCGSTSLVYQEGCVKCFACGHSEC